MENLADLVEDLRKKRTDTLDVEVKTAAGGFPRKLVRSISAFANGSGGTIILGLDERAGFIPSDGFDEKATADALAGACAEGVTPPARAEIEIASFEGALVVVAHIPELAPQEKPCWVASQTKYTGSYIRTHDGDRTLTSYEIARLEESQGQPRWDVELVDEASIDDFDPDIVQGILARERLLHPRVFGTLEDTEAMKALRMVGETADGKLVPTLAGLFAAGTYPQQYFPRLNVTFSAYPEDGKASGVRGLRFLDNQSLVGPIPIMVMDTVHAVMRNMRVGAVIDGIARKDLPDYPPVAVREAVVNALMHRDYSPQARGGQVQVNLFADHLEILSPGGLFGPVTVDSLGTASQSSTRNQRLSALLEVTPFLDNSGSFVAENRGTGYIAILNEMESQLLPPPRAHDSLTAFRLEFSRRTPLENAGLEPTQPNPTQQTAGNGDSVQRIRDHLQKYELATSRELAAAAGVSLGGVRRVLAAMVKDGVIERTEPVRSPKQRYRLR